MKKNVSQQAPHTGRCKRYQVRVPWQDNVLSLTAILSLLALTLAAVGLVLFLLLRFGILSQGIFSPAPDTQTPDSDIPSVYDMLLPVESGGSASESIVRCSGDFSTLRSLLSDTIITDAYYAEYHTAFHSSKGENRIVVGVYVYGDCFRIARRSIAAAGSAAVEELYICDGTEISYTDRKTKNTRIFPVTEGFDMPSLAGIPSVASYTETREEQTLSASYTEIEGQIVYYVRFSVPVSEAESPVTAAESCMQEYWISPTLELVIRCRTYANAAYGTDASMLYSCTLQNIRDLTEQEKNTLFQIQRPQD